MRLVTCVSIMFLLAISAIVFFVWHRHMRTTLCNDSVCELSTSTKTLSKPLPYGIHAPELVGINSWLNSAPLTLKDLRGKVILIDFWTYSCINCIRTLPHVQQWHERYKDQGLIIIGVHAPEFAFEKEIDNIKAAIVRFGITYPIAVDNDYQTWQAYDNHYWPAHYLIDQDGIIRETHFGEGHYQETENAIRQLLGLEPLTENKLDEEGLSITPETYLGYQRATAYHADIKLVPDEEKNYSYQPPLMHDQVGLSGRWLITGQYIQAADDACTLELDFHAAQVYLVMSSPMPQKISVSVDDAPATPGQTADLDEQSIISVHESRMYALLDLKAVRRHKLRLKVPRGVQLYVFTFGAKNT